jgi:Co/Zn/Cd efflux system component
MNRQSVNVSFDKSAISRWEIKRARRRAALSVGVNLSLALGKGVAGVMGGSSALLGDAVHSASDLAGSGLALLKEAGVEITLCTELYDL